MFSELSSHLGAALRTGGNEEVVSQTLLPLASRIAGPRESGVDPAMWLASFPPGVDSRVAAGGLRS